ncbi:MAG: hypothetical protein HQL56_17360 [Magnetococcales bacterium]|nr:hypothetical protein [Magnetococcales bacterium]
MFPAALVAEEAVGNAPLGLIFRLETGMHASLIRRMAIDPGQRFLVTVSDDRTARIWSLPEGKLLRILRAPIGGGKEGELYAVSVSNDGRYVAVGGYSGWEWRKKTVVYLFEVESGVLKKTLGELPDSINNLAFLPGDEYLAVGLAGNNGIRFLRVSDGALVGIDRQYAGTNVGMDVSSQGMTASSSQDGYVRLYDASFHLVDAKRLFPGKPAGVAFSPDGGSLAVGFEDQTRVEVLSVPGLNTLYAPDVSGIQGRLSLVTWSPDGQYLFAGGQQGTTGNDKIRKWADRGMINTSGTSRYVDLQSGAASLTDLLGVGGGGVLYAGADPSFGLINAEGFQVFHVGPATVNFRGVGSNLLASEDGKRVQFPYGPQGAIPARFDVAALRLEPAGASDGTMQPPLIASGKIRFTWLSKGKGIQVNGYPIKLEADEEFQSMAIMPGEQMVSLGSNQRLRLVGIDGRLLWSTVVPATVWGMVFSGNGRYLITALEDGTLRWYYAANGHEIMALYPHIDRQRWVLFSPNKLFTLSVGAENLVGWHRNQGIGREARFFTHEGLFQSFNRPDVIGQLLK